MQVRVGTFAFCIWNAHRATASVLSLPANPCNLTFESRLLKFCLFTSTVLYTDLLFRIRHTAKFYYSPEILPVNIGHLLSCKSEGSKKVLMEKLTQQLLLHKSAFMFSKYYQIPGFWPEIIRSSQYWHKIQLNLANRKVQKKVLMEKLTQQLFSAQKCFHAFEIPPNSWFLAGNISFQSILVTLLLNLAKSESSKKSAYGKTNATTAFCTKVLSRMKYHQIPGFWSEIFRSSQYWKP